MPACAALGAAYFTRAAARVERGHSRRAAGCWWRGCWQGSAAACVFIGLSGQAGLRTLLPLVLWLFLAALAMTILLITRRYLALPAAVLLTLSGCSVLVLQVLVPAYRRAFPVAEIAQAGTWRSAGRAAEFRAVLGISGDLEHWRRELCFQITRVPEQLDGADKLAEFSCASRDREWCW